MHDALKARIMKCPDFCSLPPHPIDIWSCASVWVLIRCDVTWHWCNVSLSVTPGYLKGLLNRCCSVLFFVILGVKNFWNVSAGYRENDRESDLTRLVFCESLEGAIETGQISHFLRQHGWGVVGYAFLLRGFGGVSLQRVRNSTEESSTNFHENHVLSVACAKWTKIYAAILRF